MSARDAQKIAYEKDLDLVKIAPGAKPPVCRIMDYGKYCFEQQKREKEARKNQKVVSIKEIRMFSAIGKPNRKYTLASATRWNISCICTSTARPRSWCVRSLTCRR